MNFFVLELCQLQAGFGDCFYPHFLISTDTMMIIVDRSYNCMHDYLLLQYSNRVHVMFGTNSVVIVSLHDLGATYLDISCDLPGSCMTRSHRFEAFDSPVDTPLF